MPLESANIVGATHRGDASILASIPFLWNYERLAWHCAKVPNAQKVSDGSEWRDGCVGEGGRAAGVTRTHVRSTDRVRQFFQM